MGHVPPGVCGRCGNISWMRPSFNKEFVSLLRRHHGVIEATIFGHEHTDAFHIVYDDSRKPSNLFFMNTVKLRLMYFLGSRNLVCYSGGVL